VQRLHVPDAQGRTRLAVLLQFAERTGTRHPDLNVPEPHPALAYLIGWWRELHGRRPDIHAPLSHQEIAAWAHLTGRRPTFNEVDALRRMDDACLAVHAEAAEKRAAEAARKASK
jgi:hypothetical protein